MFVKRVSVCLVIITIVNVLVVVIFLNPGTVPESSNDVLSLGRAQELLCVLVDGGFEGGRRRGLVAIGFSESESSTVKANPTRSMSFERSI